MAEVEKDKGIGVDVEKFKGLYRKLVQGMDSTLDALSLGGLP